jgi:hypothetical protein
VGAGGKSFDGLGGSQHPEFDGYWDVVVEDGIELLQYERCWDGMNTLDSGCILRCQAGED